MLRITAINPHPNADKLEIIPIEGYQAIVVKGQFKVGDFAYYIPPDSVVPDRSEYAFLWANATYEGGTPERKRRIGAKKLRGEWSEGVLMPCIEPYRDSLNGVDFYKPADFALLRDNGNEGKQIQVSEGDDVSEFLGITHYNPPEPGENVYVGGGEKKRKWPRSFAGWKQLILSWLRGERREGGIQLPTYDVEAFKKWTKTFEPGEMVRVTEKIHGSNGRFIFKKNLFGLDKFYVGSRNLWKAPGSTCAWRRAAADNPWIEKWCRLNPGFGLYGEITPTQKGYDYNSGTKVRFFVFDVLRPDGKWAELPEYDFNFKTDAVISAPVLYQGPWNEEAIKTKGAR